MKLKKLFLIALSMTALALLNFTAAPANAASLLNCELVDLISKRTLTWKSTAITDDRISFLLNSGNLNGLVLDAPASSDATTERKLDIRLTYRAGTSWSEAYSTTTYNTATASPEAPVGEATLTPSNPTIRPAALRCFVH